MNSKRKIIPYAAVFIALLIWVFFKPKEELPSTPAHYPSYIGHNVSNVHFDEFGDISHKTFADKVTSYDQSDKTLLENPKVIMFIRKISSDAQKDAAHDPDNNPAKQIVTKWQLTAKNGVLYGQEKLELTGNVFIDNLTKDQLVQTMQSESMTAMLDVTEIKTDQPVFWTGPQMSEQGAGMWASLIKEELIVKNQVKAVYYNTEKKKK